MFLVAAPVAALALAVVLALKEVPLRTAKRAAPGSSGTPPSPVAAASR